MFLMERVPYSHILDLPILLVLVLILISCVISFIMVLNVKYSVNLIMIQEVIILVMNRGTLSVTMDIQENRLTVQHVSSSLNYLLSNILLMLIKYFSSFHSNMST